jgi:hypothetical protein
LIDLSTIRCACGSPDVVAIDPGDAPETAPGGFIVSRGRAIVGRCLDCWPAASGVQQEMFPIPNA